MKQILRRAFVENAGVKAVALSMSIALFVLVHSEKDTTVYATVPVTYKQPEDRVLVSEPVDEVRIRVSGAWTRIKTFDERDVEPIVIDLDGATDGDFTLSESMFKLPAGLKVQAINPPAVTLRFEKSATKIVPVNPVLDGDLPRGYKVEQTVVRPSHVTIRGAKSVVAVTTGVRTERIPVAGRTSSFVRNDVKLAPLAGAVSVIGEPAVQVEVLVHKESGEIEIGGLPVQVRPPPWTRVDEAPTVTTEPTEVTVVLRGNRIALDELRRDKLAAFIEVTPGATLPRPFPRTQVRLEGIPEGVAVDIRPREVELRPLEPARGKRPGP